MNKKVIATIGLARGYMAFFDPISKIMLDYARPHAQIYEGTDVTGIKKALGNTIVLLSGSLDGQNDIQKFDNTKIKENSVVNEQKENIETPYANVEENKAEENDVNINIDNGSTESNEHIDNYKKNKKTRNKKQ